MNMRSLIKWRLSLAGLVITVGILLSLVGGVSINAATPQDQSAAPEKCTKAEEFKDIPGQGPSCKLPDGYWKVRLKNGSSIITHGPDTTAEAVMAEEPSGLQAASSHVCVSTTTAHGLIIYAYPSNVANNYNGMVATIRTYFQQAQDKLNAEAMQFGVSASYKMACDADGRVTVRSVRLPTASNYSSFSTIVSDLQAQGYNSSSAKYWIWWDSRLGPCGQGDIKNDDRASAGNANNVGPSYGINYGCNAMMHENGHNLGAVQHTAPNASGGHHCIDEYDVMCYSDSPNYPTMVYRCTDREHFDCNNNDYFHPNPSSNNYLYNHWNLAACYNNYIQRSGCGGTNPTPTPSTGFDPNGYYRLTVRHSGKALDVYGTANGNYARQWDWVNAINQQWRIESLGNGYYRLTARHSGKVLDVYGTANGDYARQWDWVNAINQQWTITKIQ